MITMFPSAAGTKGSLSQHRPAMFPYLDQLPLFQKLSKADLKHLGEVCEIRRFSKRETLFEEGRPADSVWIIQRGWVYLVKRTPHGVPVTVFTVTPADVLCGYSAVAGGSSYYASAVAATETGAIRIPCADFTALLRHQPRFAERVLAIYHARMRHMAEAITLAQAPVEQRVAYTLLRLKTAFGDTIPVTHRELGHMVGARWETSIRTLSMFKRKQWLSTSRGKVTVVRPDQLKALLSPIARDGFDIHSEAEPRESSDAHLGH